MPNLLVQSCSQSKNEVSDPTPAFDVYSGYFYRILKKAIRTGEFREDTDIVILSAKYGILEADEPITAYDQIMSENRAEELNEDVVDSIESAVDAGGYDRIVLNMGKTYRQSLAGLTDQITVPVAEIEGGGIGEKGGELHQFIRGDDSVPTVVNDV